MTTKRKQLSIKAHFCLRQAVLSYNNARCTFSFSYLNSKIICLRFVIYWCKLRQSLRDANVKLYKAAKVLGNKTKLSEQNYCSAAGRVFDVSSSTPVNTMQRSYENRVDCTMLTYPIMFVGVEKLLKGFHFALGNISKIR